MAFFQKERIAEMCFWNGFKVFQKNSFASFLRYLFGDCFFRRYFFGDYFFGDISFGDIFLEICLEIFFSEIVFVSDIFFSKEPPTPRYFSPRNPLPRETFHQGTPYPEMYLEKWFEKYSPRLD